MKNEYRRRWISMILEITDALLTRFEEKGNGFIDTKLDLVTGRSFDDTDLWYKQPEILFPWIQGRGLEAAAGHLAFIRSLEELTPAQKGRFTRRLRRMLRVTAENLERLRRVHHGRLFFMMRRSGEALAMDRDCRPVPLKEIPGKANYSDLFCAKGLMAAGAALKDGELLRRGGRYFRSVVNAVLQEEFITDQQMFDPRNPVLAVPGKLLQGPKMLALGGTALGMQCGERDYWERKALQLLRIIFARYTDDEFNFWEAVDTDFRPWDDGGRWICDPGHALEFTGLSAKNLLLFRTPAGIRERERCRGFYAEFLRHQFAIGFAPGPGGIIKSFDLKTKRPVNTDMPWWSLPETVRAAELAADLTGEESLRKIADRCSAAFFAGYVNPACHQMAVQTRDASGHTAPVIPATPDADPGYHTDLSVIDALSFSAGRRKKSDE